MPPLSEQELNDKIDAWHDSDFEHALHEYLGWTWEQYAHWVETDEQPK